MDNYQYVRVKNVFFTKHHQGIWSCHEMVQWINKELNCHVHSVEHLCTGAAYCGLMDKLFPGIINMLKVKFCANQEYEYLANFRLVQTAFDQVRVITQIPMLGLAKGRLSDNFEFACWFRRFVEANNKKAICPHYDPLRPRQPVYWCGSFPAPNSQRGAGHAAPSTVCERLHKPPG